MSWNWKDITEEEEKAVEYGVQGTVTISTQEYKDLLNQITKLKIAGQKEHDDWYAVRGERDKYKEESEAKTKTIEALTEEVNTFKTWIAKDDALALKYFKFKDGDKGVEEDEEDGEDE